MFAHYVIENVISPDKSNGKIFYCVCALWQRTQFFGDKLLSLMPESHTSMLQDFPVVTKFRTLTSF